MAPGKPRAAGGGGLVACCVAAAASPTSALIQRHALCFKAVTHSSD
jgi:hypothetical protein